MDSKLSQLYVPRTFSRYSSLYKKYNPISTHKQQVCRCQIQGISSNNQESTNRFLVHMVKEGETLNSISKLYGVPACDIAAVNEKIADFELFFEGQLLNIPSSITTLVQKQGKGETKFISCGRDSVVGLYSRFLNMKNSTVASVLHLSYAKRTSCGYFLVMVPVIAFCIRCIMGALNSRLFKDLEPRDSEQRCLHGTKQMRWETALLDLRDASEDDELDIRPRPEINQFTKDEDEIESNHISHHTYGKLEEDYQKFLTECGISNCGYWRGGSSK